MYSVLEEVRVYAVCNIRQIELVDKLSSPGIIGTVNVLQWLIYVVVAATAAAAAVRATFNLFFINSHRIVRIMRSIKLSEIFQERS